MTHPDEDILLKFHLEIVKESERLTLMDHLDSCDRCRGRSRIIQREIEMIGSVDPELLPPEIELPVRKREHLSIGIRAAAILLFGLFVGYGYTHLVTPSEVRVIPSCHTPSTPHQTLGEFSICESVNLEVE